MISLPIDASLPEIVDAVRSHRSAIVVAPPGAGKTTRVPPALWRANLTSGKILMLQPRRVAARAAACRMAEELGDRLGRTVGYRVRFERVESAETRILVLTEGLLTRWMQADPTLDGVGVVILDEFHERSLHADLGLAMLARIRRELREDLGVVVMSATLDPVPVSKFLNDAPIVRTAGRCFPVEVDYLDHPDLRLLPAAAAEGVRRALLRTERDVLVFLPGVGEIVRTEELLRTRASTDGFVLVPLHGELGSADQDAALRSHGLRRVVLATNVAETSITVEGVGAVVDTGFARKVRHDPDVGLDRLELTRISRASADQRAGRAGRLGPGICLRLWTRATQASLEDEERPEIARVDLAATLLELRGLGVGDPRTFGWYEAPSERDVGHGEDLLYALGLTEGPGRQATRAGECVRRWPLHPRLGRLLWAAHTLGFVREGARLCALLAERDIFRIRRTGGERSRATTRGDSDLLFRLDSLAEMVRSDYRRIEIDGVEVDSGAARMAERVACNLGDIARRDLGATRDQVASEEDLQKLVLQAFPDRVAKRRQKGSDRALMVGGTGVRLAAESIVQDHDLFVVVSARGAGRTGGDQALVSIASGIRREWLADLFPALVVVERGADFDPESESVVGREITRFCDLTLEEKRGVAVDSGTASEAIAAAVRSDPARVLQTDGPLREWLTRVEFLRTHVPELSLPTWTDSDLIERILLAAPEARSLLHLRRAPLLVHLQGELTYLQRQALDQDAPDRLQLPAGRTAAVRYESGRPPIAAAKVQHFFGVAETPRLARGRVAVLVELLAPNQRPVQLTGDLASFWRTTYAQVRKDLRGRYPKHDWPEQPPSG